MNKTKVIKVNIEDIKNLSPKNILILKEQNYTTLEDLAQLNLIDLKTILGTTENKAGLILAEVRKNLPTFKSFTGLELEELGKNQEYLKTNCTSLDALYQGGLRCGTVNEVYGAFSAGKSQLSFSAIISAILPKPYGLNGSVIFIDTEGTFEINRVRQIAKFYDHIMPVSDILQQIRVIRPTKASDQMKILKSPFQMKKWRFLFDIYHSLYFL